MKVIITFFLITFTLACHAQELSMHNCLNNAIGRLDKIKNATYTIHIEVQQPGDTLVSHSKPLYVIELTNPNDTTIGSSSFVFNDSLHTEFCYGYDGRYKATSYPEVKRVQVYDFIKTPHPYGNIAYRPIGAPFFNYVNSILKYTLTTNDSIETTFKKVGDDYYLKLITHEDQCIEFFGRDYKVAGMPGVWSDPTSQYEIWISSKDGLPYKYKRTQSHSISGELCSNYHLNGLKSDTLDIFSFFPAGYEVRWNHERQKDLEKEKKDVMLRKAMPSFELKQSDGKVVSSQKQTAKVLLVEFTGIGCGPCALAIPFLNEISSSYSPEDFQLLSIESWGHDSRQLGIYKKRNSITYPFLVGNKKVQKDFCGNSSSVPVFFIIDHNRKIRYIFNGFSRDGSGTEIKKCIDKLLIK